MCSVLSTPERKIAKVTARRRKDRGATAGKRAQPYVWGSAHATSDATNRPTNQHNKHNRSRASSCSTVHVRASKMRQMTIFFCFFFTSTAAPQNSPNTESVCVSGALQPQNAGAIHPYKKSASCGRRRNAQKNVNLGSPFTSFKGGKFEQPSAVRIARLKFMDLSDSPLLQIIIRNPGPAFFSALGRRPHEAHFL